ncbi:unnamed protein product [Cercospora beticola]|nr:unnamed protein product [Cercospora beticola]
MEPQLFPRERGDAGGGIYNSRSPAAPQTKDCLPFTHLCDLFKTLVPPDSVFASLQSIDGSCQAEMSRLRAVLPSAEVPATTGPMVTAQCSTTRLKLLTYAASNNLAGMDDQQGRASANVSILQYFESLSANLFRAYENTYLGPTLFSNDISMRPIAETLFKAAVGTGDVGVVRQILSSPECSLKINDVVVIEESSGVPFTALEFAAHCQNLALVELLVDNGADLDGYRTRLCSNKVRVIGENASMKGRSIAAEARVRGSLECALCPRLLNDEWWSPPGYNPDLISHLIECGARIQPVKDGWPCEYLLHQMALPDHDSTVDLLVSRLINSANQRSWMDSGFFHVAFDNLEQAVLHRLIDYMCSWACNFGHCDQPPGGMPPRFQFCPPKLAWRSPLQFPLGSQRPLTTRTRLQFILDICAARGHLELVCRLLDLGAVCSSETLSVAIAANQVEVAQYLMRPSCAKSYGYSSLLSSTPLAEAIYLQNTTLLMSFPSLAVGDLDFESYRAMVRAAAAIGDLERVRILLDSEKPVHINAAQRQQITNIALLEACHQKRTRVHILHSERTGNGDPIRGSCIDRGLDRSRRFRWVGLLPDDCCTICNSSWEFFFDEAKMLVAAGYSSSGAFDVAVEEGHMQLARELLGMGALIGSHALRGAVMAQDVDLVELILAHNTFPIDVKALEDAVTLGNERVISVLYSRAVKDDLHYDQGQRVEILESLVRYGKSDLLRPFLQRDNARMSPSGIQLDWLIRPLLAAIEFNGSAAFELSQAVLGAGANPNTLCSQHELEASTRSQRDRHGPSKDTGERIVTSALLEAIRLGKEDIVQLLIDFGADANMSASRGCRKTPLQQAAESGSLTLVEMLLLHGADVNAAAAVRHGTTALQLAAKLGYIGLAELLIERGADICAPGAVIGGQTAFASAADWGRFDMIKYLASRAEIPDDELRNAQRLAQANGHGAVVEGIECMMLQRHNRPLDIGYRSTVPSIHKATVQNASHFGMPEDITMSSGKQSEALRFLCAIFRRVQQEKTTQLNQKTPTEIPGGPAVRLWEAGSSDVHPGFESPNVCYASSDSRQDPSTSWTSNISPQPRAMPSHKNIIELVGLSSQYTYEAHGSYIQAGILLHTV